MTPVLSRSLTRRQVARGTVAGAAALTLLPAHARFAAAQGTSDVAALGYAELQVTITDRGYGGIPDSLPAGRNLLTATAKVCGPIVPTQTPPTVAFVSPTPAGVSAAAFLQLLATLGGTSRAGATPAPGGTPATAAQPGGGADQQLPLFIYQMAFAGEVVSGAMPPHAERRSDRRGPRSRSRARGDQFL